MLGIAVVKNGILGTTLRFCPAWQKFITNGKGLGISLTLQSPIAFHLILPSSRRKYRD